MLPVIEPKEFRTYSRGGRRWIAVFSRLPRHPAGARVEHAGREYIVIRSQRVLEKCVGCEKLGDYRVYLREA